MKRFSDLWSQIEKYVIYVFVSTFILLPILEKSFSWKIDQSYVLFLLGLLIFFVFRYIDKNIHLQRQSDIVPVVKFTAEIGEFLRGKKIKRLCILAHSGAYYYQAILESQPQVEELHLLLRNFDDPNKVGFPTEQAVRQDYKTLCDEKLKAWINLQAENGIKNIIIRRYDFDSFFHFMIVDKTIAHFGLLKPSKNYPGSTVLNSFMVTDDSRGGQDLIANFTEEFDTIFENFSDEYRES
jgi:hypothetical protein